MTSGSPHLVAEGTAAGEREGGEGGVDLEADIIFTSNFGIVPFPLSHSAPFSFSLPPFPSHFPFSLPFLLVLRLLRNPGKKGMRLDVI